MHRSIRGLCAAALVGGVVIAGCGGGSSSTSSTPSSTTTAAANTTTASKTSSSHATVSPLLAAAVTACTQSIAAAPTLSSSEKRKLESVCHDAGSGNVAAARTAVRQVCDQIVKRTIPSGSAQTSALAACQSGSGTAALPTGAAVSAAIMQAACQQYQQLGSALPGNIKSSVAAVCRKVAHGDLTGAKAELQQICERYVTLIPSGPQQTAAAATCKRI